MIKYASFEAAFPQDFNQTLISRHKIIKKIRYFFDSCGYTEVQTPVRVRCPGADPYIDAIDAGSGFFLVTSPELQMKRLLGHGIERIYQISQAFRANEEGPHHSSEFTMLEWYRTGADYISIMNETEELIKFIINDSGAVSNSWKFPFERKTIDELYKEIAGWEPSINWNEDAYFRDWVNKIEPFLKDIDGIFLFDFPAPLAALSKLKRQNTKVCERFEIFMAGIEIGNAFTELIDYDEHLIRFENVVKKRMEMRKPIYPDDDGFLKSVKSGIPECGGIAIGIDRLIMAVLGLNNIDLVQTFPLSRL